MTTRGITYTVDSRRAEDGSRKVKRSFREVRDESEKMERQTKSMERSANSFWKSITNNLGKLTGFIAGLGLATAAGIAFRRSIAIASEFEDLRVRLKVVEGSLEGAARAWDLLAGFSAKTPFQLADVTEAYVLMKNVGLDPSIESLTAIGDTAAAQGANIREFTRAAVSAAFGETEGLKRFGILMRSEGDRVAVTFKGHTQTISKDAQSIVDHLVMIGQTNFAGAMEERSKTLSGSLSTLRDNVSLLADTFGSGFLPSLVKVTQMLTEMVQDDAVQRFVEDLGKQVGRAAEVIVASIRWLGENWFAIKAAILVSFGEIVAGVAKLASFVPRALGDLASAIGDVGSFFSFLPGFSEEQAAELQLLGAALTATGNNAEAAGMAIKLAMDFKANGALDNYDALTKKLGDAPKVTGPAGKAFDELGEKIRAAFKAGATETEGLLFAGVSADVLDPVIKDLEAAQKIIESVVSEEEQYLAYVKLVEDLEGKGLLTKEQAAEAIAKATEGVSDFVVESERAASIWEGIGSTIGSLAIGGLTQVLFNDKSAKDALTDFGSSAGSILGDVLQKQGETTGQILGVSAGSALGVAMPVLGSALGSFAGAKIGEFLGGLFGDKAKVIGEVTFGDGSFSGDGADVASEAASHLNEALRQLEQILGVTGLALEEVSIRVKDNGTIWVQIAGGVSQKFSDMTAALDFAFTELVRMAELPASVADELLTAIQNSNAGDIQGMLSDLAFVKGLIDASLGDITVGFRDAVTQFHQNVQRLQGLGLDSSLAVGALAESLNGMRNQILGISESAEERIRRQAAEFNAERAVLIAEQQSKLLDLQLRLEVLKGTQSAVTASHMANVAYVQGIVDVAGATTSAAAVMGGSVAAIEAAIAATQALIDSLPAEITESDIRNAINRGRGGGRSGGGSRIPEPPPLPPVGRGRGGGRRDRLRQINDFLRRFEDETAANGIRRIREEFSEMFKLARGMPDKLEQLRKAQSEAIRRFWDDVLQPIRDLRRDLLIGSQSPLGTSAQYNLALERFNETFSKAKTGDLEAIGDLPDAARTLLEMAEQMFGSGAAFADIFFMVQDKLGKVEEIGEQAADVELMMLEEQRNQSSSQRAIAETVTQMVVEQQASTQKGSQNTAEVQEEISTASGNEVSAINVVAGEVGELRATIERLLA